MARKNLALSLLGMAALLISGCSGIKGGSGSGSGRGRGRGAGSGSGSGSGGGTGGSAGPFTIGGTVIGLSGTGLVLTNNGTEDLAITATGASIPFTFKTAVTGNYKVVVKTQPSTPTQNCSVTNGVGTAAANVTSVLVTCVPI